MTTEPNLRLIDTIETEDEQGAPRPLYLWQEYSILDYTSGQTFELLGLRRLYSSDGEPVEQIPGVPERYRVLKTGRILRRCRETR